MSDPAPILDYAGPRAQGKLRLPSRSVLDVSVLPERVAVTEKLTGKAAAVAAIAFSLFVMLLQTLGMVGMAGHGDLGGGDVTGFLLYLILWLAQAVLIPLVIHNTWRRTILEATGEGLTLVFRSPYRLRQHQWPRAVIDAILMIQTAAADRSGQVPVSLGELQVRVQGLVAARLFTDHEEATLRYLAAALEQALGLRKPAPVIPVAVADPKPDVPPAAQPLSDT